MDSTTSFRMYVYMSIFLAVGLFDSLSVYITVCLHDSQSIYLTVCLSDSISDCLSVYLMDRQAERAQHFFYLSINPTCEFEFLAQRLSYFT